MLVSYAIIVLYIVSQDKYAHTQITDEISPKQMQINAMRFGLSVYGLLELHVLDPKQSHRGGTLQYFN